MKIVLHWEAKWIVFRGASIYMMMEMTHTVRSITKNEYVFAVANSDLKANSISHERIAEAIERTKKYIKE